MPKSEEEINAQLEEKFASYIRQVERMQNGLVGEVDSTRINFIDIVEKYADENGVIDKKKLRKLLRELESMHGEIRETILDDVKNTIDYSNDKAKKDILAALGILAVGMIGSKAIMDEIKTGILTDKAKDGLTLDDRINRFSGNLIDEIRKTVRDGIYRGQTTNQINRAIKKTVEKQSWQLKRLIGTVAPGAYRRTIANMASEGKNVKAVRIIDRRGRHKNHETHECYRLAEQDKYGWGKGVYRPEDKFIYDPHPNCTAYYEIVLFPEKEVVSDVDG